MVIVALILALQQPAPAPAQPTTPAPPARTAPAAAPRRAQPATVTLNVLVTDRSGRFIPDAAISVEGATSKDATSDAKGQATVRGLTAGAYRVRVEAERFISLEKEINLRGTAASQQFSLSRAADPEPVAAPPPPPPPPPAPVAALAQGPPGEPKVVSIPDLAEQSLGGRDAVKVVPITCSGMSNVRLIVLRDTLPLASHKDESQTLYLVSGQAALTIRDTVQQLSPGTVGVVPRAVPYALEKKGRNPAVLLSITAGHPCGEPPATQ